MTVAKGGAPSVILPNQNNTALGHPRLYASAYSSDISTALRELSDAQGDNWIIWLQAALAAVLYRHTYQDEFGIDCIRFDASAYGDSPERPTEPQVQIHGCHFTADHSATAATYSRGFAQQWLAPAKQQNLSFDGAALVLCDSTLDSFAKKRLLRTFARDGVAVALLLEHTSAGSDLTWLCHGNADEHTGARLDTHLRELVAQMSSQPERPLLQHNMLSAAELHELDQFGRGEHKAIDLTPVFQRVEHHATARADQVAAEFAGQQMTYADLNRRANRLAYHLLAQGVLAGDKVAVCIAPSLEALVAIIGLHKVGAVYVPVDPGFPQARITAIFAEVQPRQVLIASDESCVPASYRPYCVDLHALPASDHETVNPEIAVLPGDLSHVFFTSGTTGNPKGVVSSHSNLTHYITCAVDRYGFTDSDVFIAAARFTFSISMFELLTPLAVGACVKILPRSDILNMAVLAEEVSQATVFHFGPSLLKQLLPYIEDHYSSYAAFSRVRHASSGGDVVPADILERLKHIFANAEVFVIYGSSEVSCMGCTYEVPRDKVITRSKVGRPHQNMQVEILDAQGMRVPVGVVGQLHFAGDGVVVGYLNQPQLTAEKFTERNGKRYYAIGDVGRFDSDGNIELLGRQDFQVQIRGMRIELLEIEQCLKQHPAISDCVVVARNLAEAADPVLVGYVVVDSSQAAGSNLSDYLSSQLPDYMVPSLLVQLEQMPLNNNGKLDRSQLPAPEPSNILLSEGFDEPADDTERALLSLFEQLFSMTGIGVNHSFFELGGDSLQAVKLLIDIDKQFGRFIPIGVLPNYPTVRQLAQLLSSDEPADGVGDVVVLRESSAKDGAGVQAPLFCLYGVLLYRDLALSLDTERMVCGVYLQEEVALMEQGLESEAMSQFLSIDHICERYLQTITAFQPQGPYYLAGESFGGIIAMEVARRLRLQGEEVALVAMFDSHAPGFYESLPLWRKALIHGKNVCRNGPGHLAKATLDKFKRHMLRAISGRHRAGATLGSGNDTRADARAIVTENYQPQTFEYPVVLCTAKVRSEFAPLDPALGWGKYLPQLTLHTVEGDHLGILKQPNVQDLAAKIQAYL